MSSVLLELSNKLQVKMEFLSQEKEVKFKIYSAVRVSNYDFIYNPI